jgi:hypothetical protein
MKKKFLKFLTLVFLFPTLVLAAGLVPCGGEGEQPCTLCHFFLLFEKVYVFILKEIAPPLAAFFIALAGFMYVFAYTNPLEFGKPSLLNDAKKIISSTIFGLFLLFASWVIVNVFFQVIGVAEWTNLKTWWQINCP